MLTSEENKGICLKAQLDKRQRVIQYQVQVGTNQYMHQTYIYTKDGGMIPGARIPVNQPIYETRRGPVVFISEIEFFIFRHQGSTCIYAVGTPVDLASSIKAGYGATIRHACWPMVTGKEEFFLIQEIYTYLKNLKHKNISG